MNERDFAYWLQGFVENNPEMKQPTPDQWKSIKDHLQLVFTKMTPGPEEKVNLPPTFPPMPVVYPPHYTPSYPNTPWYEPPYKVTCTLTSLDGKSTLIC